MCTKKYLPFICFIFFSVITKAQTGFNAKTWFFIDSSIAVKSNLTDLKVTVQQLHDKAIAEKSYWYAARCLNYQMQIADLKTEDSLYFKNSAFMDELLQEQQPKQMQFALHLMLANRLCNFKIRYKRFEISRYERKDIPVNYAANSVAVLDSIAQFHFEQAKAIAKEISLQNIEEALWLSSDALQFLYKPSLFDIAIAEQLRAVKVTYYYRDAFTFNFDNWVSLPADELILKIDTVNGQPRQVYKDIRLYKEWLNNQQGNPANFYFIEMLLHKYLYDLVKKRNTNLEKVYETYLLQCSRSNYYTVKAYGVYQLCLLWNSQANRYFPSNRSVYDNASYTYRNSKNYDTANRYKAVQALQLFTANKALLDSFTYLKNILSSMEVGIRKASLQISLQQNNLPGENFLAELKFKNADTLFYAIVRTSAISNFMNAEQNEQIKALLQIPKSKTSGAGLPDVNELMRQLQIKQNLLVLPPTADHNYHNVFINMEAMQAGHYAIVFSSSPLSDTTVLRQHLYFNVTNIALVNNDTRIYVLSRKNGKPLTGTTVKASYKQPVTNGAATNYINHEKFFTVNQQGFIEIGDKHYTDLLVNFGTDSIAETAGYNEYQDPDDIYSKSDYDDLADFYNENATAFIYTDRSIYRPGQTVFYKAVFITKNKNTGEPMVMNKKNMDGNVFNRVYKNFLKKEKPLLQVSDPFNKITDSIKIVPNDFGSVYGSFKIPKTAATGDWEISPDDIDVRNNGGKFKVEEYKRPSYEMEIIKPKKELKLGDSFLAKVKIRSFAGAALNNVKIKYAVRRSGSFKEYDVQRMQTITSSENDIVIDTTGYTNNNGELEITVQDSNVLKKTPADTNDWHMGYDIYAEAIDATGESYERTEAISLAAKPINIRLTINARYNRADLPPISVITSDRNAGTVNKNVHIKIYRLIKDTRLFNNRTYTSADVWLYDKTALQSAFPYDNILMPENKVTEELLYETTIHTAEKEKLILNENPLTAGNYKLEATCKEGENTRGEITRYFSVYDTKENKLPESSWSFSDMPFNTVSPGETFKYVYGNAYGETYSIFHVAYFYHGKKKGTQFFYNEKLDAKGLQQYSCKVPGDAADQLKLTQLYILNNQLFQHEENIYISAPVTAEPEIIIEQYRKKLTPGSTETFSVSIKTKNESTAAELMTTLYDASLDKLEPHNWQKPNLKRRNYIDVAWTGNINSINKNDALPDYMVYFVSEEEENKKPVPLWWINPSDNSYDQIIFGKRNNARAAVQNFQHDLNPDIRYNGDDEVYGFTSSNMLAGRVAGVSISDADGLKEVVVTSAFSTVRAKSLTGSVSTVTISGTSTLTDAAQPLIILDGLVYTGDLSKLDPKTITAGLILKGADAVAVYGSKAAGGVLILSTKGEIILPKDPEPVITPRKNFSETAFFFPAIHAGADGFYTISFTMPESVTEWNWKLLAHTKNALFAYTERKLNTQLPLMVQPNMPRLLYQGDTVILQSRISNLDTTDASGKIICKIEDVVTGEDITSKFTAAAQNKFAVQAKANTAAAFTLTVPAAQLNPVKIMITVRSQNFADGEEYIIPILSPRVFVREQTPFWFSRQKDTSISLPPLPADAAMFGLGLSVPAKPQAALLNALPALANYPYDCAEQTFNKLLAYTTAYKLMRSDTTIQSSFTRAKQWVEKENEVKEKLPDEPANETMPWLHLANETAKEQQQLFNVLDTAITGDKIETLVNRLQKLQQPNGGISWFNGGNSNVYMSDYILKGLGKLVADQQQLPNYVFNSTSYKTFLNKLVSFCDADFISHVANKERYNGLFYAYCRSYQLQNFPLGDSVRQQIKTVLSAAWKNNGDGSLYNQALLIITSFKYANDEKDIFYIAAAAQLEKIKQQAIMDEQNGLRWKQLADDDDLTNTAEETIALLAEAFALQQGTNEVNRGIIKWLLTAKNEHSWSNTKATAAAINLLAKENKTVSGETQSIQLTTGKSVLHVSNDLLKGKLFEYTATTAMPPAIALQNQGGAAASGNLYRYYFTSAQNAGLLNTAVQVSKEWYKWNSSNNTWQILLPGSTVKISDKIKVVLTVQSSRPLKYVFIDDKRAAAFEPADNNSGYQYDDELEYYQSVRDAGHQFFIDFIPSGKHRITYELKVAQEGRFTNGIATLQCMYRPDIMAYSNGIKIMSER